MADREYSKAFSAMRMKFNCVQASIIVLLMLFLTLSILLNLFLFDRGKQYYYQLNLDRLDPLNLKAYPSQIDQNADSERLWVVFFGDSRADQWPAPAGFEQIEFINRGIGGQTSAQIAGRFDEHVAPLHPDVLLIQMCINDLKTIPMFPEMESEIIADCKNNLEWSVQRGRDQGAVVILTTIFPLGKLSLERSLFWSEDVGKSIEEVNQFINSLQAEDVIVLDTGKILADESGLVRDEYQWDLLHLNEAGYRALNQELAKILEKVEQARATKTP